MPLVALINKQITNRLEAREQENIIKKQNRGVALAAGNPAVPSQNYELGGKGRRNNSLAGLDAGSLLSRATVSILPKA